MTIGIASDHRGYKLKKLLKENLSNYNIIDYGTDSEESTDYVDYAVKVGNAINNKEIDLGILICGTGIGMSIAANKIKGIRCARVVNVNETVLAREHNMANVIALSENTPDYENIVKTFINTKESTEERHIRRVNKIMDIERS